MAFTDLKEIKTFDGIKHNERRVCKTVDANGKFRLDIRVQYLDSEDEVWKFTRQGVSFTAQELVELGKVVTQAIAEAKKFGTPAK